MKARLSAIITAVSLTILVILMLLGGCSSGTQGGLPSVVYVTSSGQSGMAKFVSWTSIMEADTGMAIRVIPENSPVKETVDIRSGKMLLGSASKSAYRNVIEALEDMAIKDGGAYQVRIVWVNDLAHSGFFVRGDSSIKTTADIKPGTRFAVWDLKDSTLNPSKSLLAWVQLTPKDIVWVNAGSYDGAMRAVVEGRADIAFCFPTSPAVFEASSAPQGIRFIDLNAEKDPQGAKRWQAVNRLYSFGPIAAGAPPAIGRWGTVGYISIATRAESDPELIYRIAKWLDENHARYKDAYASNQFMTLNHLMENLKTIYIPVHDGLKRLLKEKGLWTAAHDVRQEKNIALLTTYQKAYADAIAQAEKKGLKIDPTNKEWIALWENLKIERKIPYIAMHVNLTEDAPVILYGQDPEKAEATAPAPAPAPAPVPTPAPKPSPASAPASGVKVQFISLVDPVKVDSDAKVVVKTEPGAECKIVVTLSSGQVSGFPKDNVKTADSAGNVEWVWQITKHTLAGDTRVEVTAKLGDKTGTATASFKIDK